VFFILLLHAAVIRRTSGRSLGTYKWSKALPGIESIGKESNFILRFREVITGAAQDYEIAGWLPGFVSW
jgi:hypothetical protein